MFKFIKLKINFVLILICFLSLSSGEEQKVENEDFYEINALQFLSHLPVKFGVTITGNNATRFEHLLEDLGPSFNLAFWHGMWEVSAAAPAPREASDEQMKDWVDTIYMNLKYYMNLFLETSDFLKNNKIDLIDAAITVPNSYFMTPNQRVKWLEYQQAIREGREPEMVKDSDFTKEYMEELKRNENEFDKYSQLTPEFLPDVAKFYVYSLMYLDSEKFHIPYVELSYEPDSKEVMYVDPDDYATMLKLIKYELKDKKIDLKKHKFVGPGTSSPTAAKPYIEALVKNRDAYDMLHSWSLHVWDNGNSVEEIEHQILGFKQIIQATVPSSWPKKQVKVTAFGYKPASRQVNKDDDLEYNGDLGVCYKGLHNQYHYKMDNLPNTMSQSPEIAVRLLANLVLQYSHGFRESIYVYSHDYFWSQGCNGLFDRIDRPKQLYVSLSTLLPYLEQRTRVVRKQWTNKDDCVIAVFRSLDTTVFVMVNLGEKSCSRSFSVKGTQISNLRKATTHSYNNGTISLNAKDPSRALVTSLNLDYDVYSAEDNVTKVLEFDLSIKPTASVVAVFDYTKYKGGETILEDDVYISVPYDDEPVKEEVEVKEESEVKEEKEAVKEEGAGKSGAKFEVKYEEEIVDNEVTVHAEL